MAICEGFRNAKGPIPTAMEFLNSCLEVTNGSVTFRIMSKNSDASVEQMSKI
jgi:hypothetical protein